MKAQKKLDAETRFLCLLVIYITKLPILEQINVLHLPVTMGANPAVFARFLAKHLVRQEIVRTCGVAVSFFTTSWDSASTLTVQTFLALPRVPFNTIQRKRIKA